MTFGTNLAAAMIVVAASLEGGVAYAQQNDQAAETAALAGATITATEAIAAVEKAGNGKVVELTLEGHGTAIVYTITLMHPDGSEANYAVDARTGAVVETGEAASDDQGDGDGEVMDDGPQQGQDQGYGDGEAND
jgi:uncharacterized membrane protein YkoI